MEAAAGAASLREGLCAPGRLGAVPFHRLGDAPAQGPGSALLGRDRKLRGEIEHALRHHGRAVGHRERHRFARAKRRSSSVRCAAASPIFRGGCPSASRGPLAKISSGGASGCSRLAGSRTSSTRRESSPEIPGGSVASALEPRPGAQKILPASKSFALVSRSPPTPDPVRLPNLFCRAHISGGAKSFALSLPRHLRPRLLQAACFQ